MSAIRTAEARRGISINMEEVLLHSYADFHAKGFDYLCLHRSPHLTIKAYFFDGDLSQAPEVVMPHDHRYAFTTQVLSGASRNRRYRAAKEGDQGARPYEAFDYRTVLNGGDGFRWRETAWLREVEDTAYPAGEGYLMFHDTIHTIALASTETVLLLFQGADRVPVGEPTSAYRPEGVRAPPSLSGLYREIEADEALERIALLRRLMPTLIAEDSPATPPNGPREGDGAAGVRATSNLSANERILP